METGKYEKIITKIKNPAWSGFLVLAISILIFILSSRILYTHTVNLLTHNLRERILTISITAAANIDAEDLKQLRVESDWQKPEWARVVNRLHQVKYSNENIVFMYIFRKIDTNPEVMEFVADADSIDPYANESGDPLRMVDVNRDGVVEPDGPDKLQWPGQEYPEAVDIPEAFEAYKGPLTSSELYTDAYGTVLTGYAPIKDSQGNTVAVLATDIKADDFFSITRQTLQPFLIFIILLSFIIAILEIVIIFTWKKYAKSLEYLNTQIKIANEKLRELDKLKSEFLSLATHQIRSPLTAIKGYSSMLLDGDYGELPIKARQSVKTIFASCQHLIDIVEDFLNISRIEQGRMVYNKENLDIKALTKEAVEELLPNAEKAGLKLTLSTLGNQSILVNGDKNKLKQVLHDLIDNGIKYTKQGGIEVQVLREDLVVHVKITDTGIGIDPSEIGKLFGKFSRASDAYRQNTSGTGLGLYIAKKMVEAHDGSIKIHSLGKGKGATFTIELPLAKL
ncbi:MAG: HAMP domain-containing sensor histidine kinase [Patescibacteria group bacterium]